MAILSSGEDRIRLGVASGSCQGPAPAGRLAGALTLGVLAAGSLVAAAGEAPAASNSGSVSVGTQAEQQAQEYRLKAAFAYNFLKFITSDKTRKVPAGEKPVPIRMGVSGPAVALEACRDLAGKEVGKRPIELIRLDLEQLTAEGLEKLPPLEVVFLCEQPGPGYPELEKLLERFTTAGTLTIGEERGFLERGGMLNFVLKERRVKFEIGTAALKRGGLTANAQLLKLAERVYKPREEKKRDK